MSELEQRMKAFDWAYKNRKRAEESRKYSTSPFPFHWEYEEFCKQNNVNCSFDFVGNEYLIYP